MKLTFSVNQHDEDGDVYDECVYLHIERIAALRFDNANDLEEFARQILGMLPEIKESYPAAFAESEEPK